MSKREYKESKTSDESQEHHSKRPEPTPFPFLRLPAELRNLVYTHVFNGNMHKFFGKGCFKSFQASNLGLLLVSRQVHAECALLPYKLSSFNFFMPDDGSPWIFSIRDFVEERTEQQRQVIKILSAHWYDMGETRTATYWFEYFDCERRNKKRWV